MVSYIANYGRITPCFVNEPGPEPIVQLFCKDRMSYPMVLKGKQPIYSTSEEAYEVLKARIVKLEGSDLWSYDQFGINQYQLVEDLGNQIKARLYLDGFGYPHVFAKTSLYSSFEQVTQDFLRDSMLEVWEFNACDRQTLINQYKDLTPFDLSTLRFQDRLQQASRIRRNIE